MVRLHQFMRRMTNSCASDLWRRILFLTVMIMLTMWANYEAADRTLEYLVVVKTSRVDMSIGEKALTVLLMEATHFVHNLLYANPHYPRKDIHTVVLSIDNKYTENALTEDNKIHINSEYLADLVDEEIRGLVYREMGRLWLWDGGRKAPLGLLEGMAEYIRLAAGFNVSNPSALRNELDSTEQGWDEGGLVTAMYLQYCEGIKSGFVADLNARMETEWREDLLEELLGKSAATVWSEFKKIIKNKIRFEIGTALPGSCQVFRMNNAFVANVVFYCEGGFHEIFLQSHNGLVRIQEDYEKKLMSKIDTLFPGSQNIYASGYASFS